MQPVSTSARIPQHPPPTPPPSSAAPPARSKGVSSQRQVDVLIAAMTAAWVVVALSSAPNLSVDMLWRLGPVVLLTCAVGFLGLSLYINEARIGFTAIGSIAAGVLFGVPGALVCSFCAMMTGFCNQAHRFTWRGLLFNVSSTGLANSIAAVGFLWVSSLLPDDDYLFQLPGAVAASALVFVAETFFLSLVLSLSGKRTVQQMWQENFRWQAPTALMFGLVGFALAIGYQAIGLMGLAGFAAPALLLRYSMKQTLDRTTKMVVELRVRNEDLESANRDIAQMTETLRETYFGTLEALVAAIDARDEETYGHSVRVAQMTMALARQVGIEEDSEEWTVLERGALLHDIGKIGVSDTILRKPGKLTDAEWIAMREHTRIGFDMLKDIPFLSGASSIVAAHHERWDGKGYPRGLMGEQIPLGARIFMLADTFDAMATDRPYRKRMPYEVCRDEILRCSGSQFDPHVVECFLVVFEQWVAIHSSSLNRVEVRARDLIRVAA